MNTVFCITCTQDDVIVIYLEVLPPINGYEFRAQNELIIKMITYNNNDLRLNFLMRH